MRKIIVILITIGILSELSAQTGIGTSSPLSTLHNTGSFAGNYKANPGVNYTLGDDYVVDYTDNVANTVYTLPSIPEGTPTNRNGRIYIIRNGSATNTLTIKASGSELIQLGTTSSNTFTLEVGRSIIIVRNSLPVGSNTTWNIIDQSLLTPPTFTVVKKFYRSPSIVTNTITLNSSTTNTATAVTLNKLSTGSSSDKALLDNNFTLTKPKSVTISFTAATDDISSASGGTPYVYYYLEIYNTATNTVVAGTGESTMFATKIQMSGGWPASFTFSGKVDIPAGTYNARLKAYITQNPTTVILGFTSYAFTASYINQE
jgi:hypothetical protein